jgi:gliding motility-associated-like protein
MKALHFLKGFTAILLMFCALSSAKGQVMVNEYSASNVSTMVDMFGQNEDWIELYNFTGSTMDISGFFLSDDPADPLKWEIPAGTMVAPVTYTVIMCSGRDLVQGGQMHTNFEIKQTRPEAIVFSDAAGVVIDLLPLDTSTTQSNHSIGRTSDAAAVWSYFTTPTPGASNVNPDPPYVSTPIFSNAGGYYSGSLSFTISTPDANSEIYYSTDGSVPTQASTLYIGTINIFTSGVVRARTFSLDPTIPPSFVETNTFFIDITHTVPIISISGALVDDLLDGTVQVPTGSIEYFGADGVLLDKSVGEFLQYDCDAWAYDQRPFQYRSRDEFGYNHAIQSPLFQTTARAEFQNLIVKAAGTDNFSADSGIHMRDAYVQHLSQTGGMELDQRSWAPAVLYVNGTYWGLYDSREMVADPEFTEYYYEKDVWDIDYMETSPGGTVAIMGSMNHWSTLYAYAVTQDMSVQANYDYVDSLMNIPSFVDFIILNSAVVNAGWLNRNTSWWHGHFPDTVQEKFRWSLWDMEHIFDNDSNYIGIQDTSAFAFPCDMDSLSGDTDADPQGFMTLLDSLKNNPGFFDYYKARWVDLMNTTLSCERMLAVYDSMAAAIAPEMEAQCTRWGGVYSEWEAEVDTVRMFIASRCGYLADGVTSCYGLSGPYLLEVDVFPAGTGDVQVNSLLLDTYIWTGNFYAGVPTWFTAYPEPGWVFDWWEYDNNELLPELDSITVYTDIVQLDNVTAHFRVEGTRPGTPILSDFIIEVPTAFSPNNDGMNDDLEIFYNDVIEFEMQIYNRWGQLMWKTEDPAVRWEGTFDGQLLQSGVYTWKIYAKFEDETDMHTTGSITLMR